MERWSVRLPDGRAVHAGFGLELPKGDPWERIAAYEDTGLTPEEITTAADRRHNCKIDCLLEKHNEVVAERDTLKKALESVSYELAKETSITNYDSAVKRLAKGIYNEAVEQAQKQEATP